jgi:hypothetical protein
MKNGEVNYYGEPNNLFMNIDEDSSIEIPLLYKFINILKDKGIDIDLSKIRNIDDLVNFIKEKVKKNG